MIVTLTPNPSFDRTLHIDQLDAGEVHRVTTTTTEAGGKGVNVSRALALGGIANRCVIPAGSSDAAVFGALLVDSPLLERRVVDTGASIRTNISLVEADGRTTKINEAGAQLESRIIDELLEAVADASRDASWIAACGSLPPGLGPDFYRRVVERVAGTNTRVAVDASGEALQHAIAGGCNLVKPNHHELAELLDRQIHTLGDVVDAATEVQRSGVETVVVSLGADGAILVSADRIVHGVAPSDVVRNTVGAGDAFLSGFLAGFDAADASAPQSLVEALAWGRAAVRSPTTSFPPADEHDRGAVHISESFDRSIEVGNQ